MTASSPAPSSPARTPFASDAEVLELVARHALDVELSDRLDRRRLRRLNSALGRYRLARRAAARTGRRERRTTRRAIAHALYGPDVELDDVRRQLGRVEADLAAAGLLEVEVETTAGGRPLGVRERLLEVPRAQRKPGRRARRHLARRPETRAQARRRCIAPHRRQQSDRKPRGGVPGLYVRADDVELLERELPPRARAARRRGAHLEIARVGVARSLRGTGDRTIERDAPGRARPPDAGAALEASRSAQDSTRSSGSTAPRNRWAALSRLRTAGTEREGPERLRQAARSGAPPCSVAVAAFEGRFVLDGPWSWHHLGQHPLELELQGEPYSNPAGVRYRPIGTRWAAKLEAYCRIHDRATGEPGSGLLWLLEDVLSWAPEDGAPAGGRLTGVDPGWPASLAYFIARLGVHAKALRRRQDPRRRSRSFWHRY